MSINPNPWWGRYKINYLPNGRKRGWGKMVSEARPQGQGIEPGTFCMIGKRQQRHAMVLVATSQAFPACR